MARRTMLVGTREITWEKEQSRVRASFESASARKFKEREINTNKNFDEKWSV